MNTIFEDRVDAGGQLAVRFADLRDQDDVIVLGLARGGVPVAAEVAREIGVPLDVLVVRKLGVPNQPELAMGAIASGDHVVLDHELIAATGVGNDAVTRVMDAEVRTLHEREEQYRAGRSMPELAKRTVVLIDDGLATGSTMEVAVQVIRAESPGRILVGVPVGARDSVDRIRGLVDRVECLLIPRPFRAVGMWYRDFRPTTDSEVMSTLSRDAWPD